MENQVIEMAGSSVTKQSQQNAVAVPSTPADMVMYALQNNGSLEQIRELMQMRREWEADEARKAFNAAKAAFKTESIVITKDRENKQYKSTYTTLGNLVGTVTPFLSKHGLSADWTIDQVLVPGQITVACILSHALGHSEKVSFTVPPDTAGAKNPIQQIKSSITYAKAVTFESVCGLASTDANEDDDGNKFGTTDTKLADSWIAKVKAATTDEAVLKVWNEGAGILEAKDTHGYDEFKNVVASRRGEIKKGGAK